MADQVAAYHETINQLNQAVVKSGGFTWMMMAWDGARVNAGVNKVVDPATCKAALASACVAAPPQWKKFTGYAIPAGGFGMTPQGFTDWTSEFLLTRGPYAILGYTCVEPPARARKCSPAPRPHPAPLPPPPPFAAQLVWLHQRRHRKPARARVGL
jgi:hypothetical protein